MDSVATISSQRLRILHQFRNVFAEFENHYGLSSSVTRAIDDQVQHMMSCAQDNSTVDYNFYCAMEQRVAHIDYMPGQREITPSKREILVKWMAEVVQWFELLDDVLFLSVNYVDQFLTNKAIPTNKLQLLGTTAIFIAAKVIDDADDNGLPLKKIAEMLEIPKLESMRAIIGMERSICETLNFHLLCPTTIDFLRIFNRVDSSDTPQFRTAVRIAEISLVAHTMWNYTTSFLASAIWLASLHITCDDMALALPLKWSQKMTELTNYTADQLRTLTQAVIKWCTEFKSANSTAVIVTHQLKC